MHDDTVPLRLPGRHRRTGHPGRRASTVGLAALGVLLVVAAVFLVARVALYKNAAEANAASLSDDLARRVAEAASGERCLAPPPSEPTPHGEPRMLLTIPAIGLTAPVLEGTDDKSLDVGVGHVPSSNWPNQGGSSVVAAHNATFFVRLGDLKPGDTITLTAPCRQWVYRVSEQEVVDNTTAVPTSAESRLFLVTCWPINALFNTAERYLLTADLVSVDNNYRQAAPTATPADRGPTWSATLPSQLAGASLSAQAIGAATGSLVTTGNPSAAWQSSPASLNAVTPATQLFAATIRTARTGNLGWWSTLAPDMPRSALGPLLIAPRKIAFQSPLDLTVAVDGDALARVDLTATAWVGSGLYRIEATATPNGDLMSLTAWTMILMGGTPPTAATPTTSPPPPASAPPPIAAPEPSSTPPHAEPVPIGDPQPTGETSPPWKPSAPSSSPVATTSPSASPSGSPSSPSGQPSASPAPGSPGSRPSGG